MEHIRQKSHKKHPDFPKKPLTAYICYFKEMRPHYSQKYPKLSNQELTKILSGKYKQLPEHMKQKYFQDFQREKQEYEEKLARFREDHPDLVQDSKKSDFFKKGQAQASRKSPGNGKHVRSPPERYGLSRKLVFLGEPKKPPMNAYHKFHQDLWGSPELRSLHPRERMVEVSRRWQRVPQSQREHFTRQAEELQRQYKVNLDLWLQSLSPEEYAVYKEANYGKGRNMLMTGGPNPNFRQGYLQPTSIRSSQEAPIEKQMMQALGKDHSEHIEVDSPPSQRADVDVEEDGEEDEGSNSSDSVSEDEDEAAGKMGMSEDAVCSSSSSDSD
ncbi:upstream-binding factor 1-like protein 1 [Oryctolagus cuniculus]|uniref:upstream-binding factor 1-like protein 1 n=1 Tax=Oryctolagus cuniculus TaxID=9986 RepID=UPI00387A2D06